jgi:2-polyprenyl-3-methyl-5-hydroxy-6-metoxy-1,4-benzoquinol methylase
MNAKRIEKNQLILNQIKPGQRILHVGCTNSPCTEARWDDGMLLHKIICDHANPMGCKIVGIDIDDSAISFLNERMTTEEILNVDAHKLSDHFSEREKFDLIIAGDVIEHLPNPGNFLTSCRDALTVGGEIVITTVNAYSIVRFLKALLFHEAVHHEHCSYYSHKTLDRLFSMCGLSTREAFYYKCEPLNLHFSYNRAFCNLIENSVCSVLPQYSEGVAMLATVTMDPTK